jgi:Flp pilus assembly protein TadG
MFRTLGNTLAVRAAQLRAIVGRFGANSRGNVAIICAVSAVPLIAAVGCVVDFSYASMVKTKLQAAADAATVATVSNNSPIVTTAKSMGQNGAVTGGAAYAQNFFNTDTSAFSGVTASGSVNKSGTTITANLTFSYNVPTTFMKVLGHSNIAVSGSSTASVTVATYISFYLMLDVSGSMSFPSTTSEQERLMAVNPDNLHPSNSPPNNGYPQGCQFACHFASQNTVCQQTSTQSGSSGPWQGSWPPAPQQYTGAKYPIASQWPSGYPGGYCLGFIITRLGTTPASITGCTNDSTSPAKPSGHIAGTSTNYPSGCGQYVNWSNSQVSSCSTAGTTSCIQLRADAVGYAVTALLSQAQSTEAYTGISNQFSVGLFPFIQNLCTSAAGSSNSCSVGLTTSLTGATINNFAEQLANLLDTGSNATLGSGGTHFENALKSMNTFITSVGTGGSAASPLPYVFLVTDGSQDYQTQWNGGWGSQNGQAVNGSWSATNNIPYQNSATVLPGYSPNDEPNSTDYCATMKSRGITVAVLYIPYATIQNPNTAFASDEDGYANANTQYIPGALQGCASPGFYFTATTPQDIQNALIQMFEQSIKSAHVAQ